MSMTLESAPPGTIVRLGHPANNHTATKGLDGVWRSNYDHRALLDLDPRDTNGIVYKPTTDTRGECVTCGRVMALRLDGAVRKHRGPSGACDGSEAMPNAR